MHCRECSWTGNLFSPGFDTARPSVLLLTLAKHSDNYFCWFQIAFSSRVWSQQVFFACWACPFRHPKRSRRKDDGFFFIFIQLYFGFPWTDLLFQSRESKGEAHGREVGLIVVGESRSGTSLSEGSCCRKLLSCMSLPAAPHLCLSMCMHTACPERRGVLPPLHGHAQPPEDPASNLQSFIFLPLGGLRSTVSPRPP